MLVKWWLLAIPHYLVLGIFLGGGGYAAPRAGEWATGTGGLVGLVALFAGVALLVLGVGVSAAGSLGLWADATQRDADGYLGTGAKSFRSNGYALSFGTVDLRWTEAGWPIGEDWLGDVELRADRDVFLGLGPADDVNRYLAGVEHDEVQGIGPEVVYRHRDGGPPPAAPVTRPIWVASGTGSLTWHADEGTWAVAVLNPDGSRVVDTQLSARATVPALGWISTALLLGGVLVVVFGGTTLLMAVVRSSRNRSVVLCGRSTSTTATTRSSATAPSAAR